MSSWRARMSARLNVRLGALCATLWPLLAGAAAGDTPPQIAPPAAYAEIARTGELRDRHIAGDIDVSRLRAPVGARRIVLSGVRIDGSLRASAGGPALPLHIVDQSRLANIDLRQTSWPAALIVENSVVGQRAWFDGARFDGEFALHATTFEGQALFRGTRFAGAVDITASRFAPTGDTASSVSFSDARFAAPARFDRSEFARGVRFDTARFASDASFIGVNVPGRASWRNVIFGGDAEFRFCRLGEADFGDAEQMSVFMRLADFRGCRVGSLRIDYADARGDLLLVNVESTADVSLRHAALRGTQNDFRGLQVGGKLNLQKTQIGNLQLDWFALRAPLLRANAGSEVLRPLQRRLEELKKDEEARDASALLADRVIGEQLALPQISLADRALLWFERLVWGRATGYGTRLGRILGVALGCWLLLALPLLLAPRVTVAELRNAPETLAPLHRAVAASELHAPAASRASRSLHKLGYLFTLMFTWPDRLLRPVAPLAAPWRGYLLVARGVGLTLLALIALTLTKVSPAIQAIVGKITH